MMLDFKLTHYLVFNDKDFLFVINKIYDKCNVMGIVDTKGEFCSLIEDNGYKIFEKADDKFNEYPAIITVIPNYDNEVVKIIVLPFKGTDDLNKSCLKNSDNETNEKSEIINLIYKSSKTKFEYVKEKHFYETEEQENKTVSKDELILFIIKSKEKIIGYYDKEIKGWKIEFSDDGYHVTTVLL